MTSASGIRQGSDILQEVLPVSAARRKTRRAGTAEQVGGQCGRTVSVGRGQGNLNTRLQQGAVARIPVGITLPQGEPHEGSAKGFRQHPDGFNAGVAQAPFPLADLCLLIPGQVGKNLLGKPGGIAKGAETITNGQSLSNWLLFIADRLPELPHRLPYDYG